jgi:hypothetical protein
VSGSGTRGGTLAPGGVLTAKPTMPQSACEGGLVEGLGQFDEPGVVVGNPLSSAEGPDASPGSAEVRRLRHRRPS